MIKLKQASWRFHRHRFHLFEVVRMSTCVISIKLMFHLLSDAFFLSISSYQSSWCTTPMSEDWGVTVSIKLFKLFFFFFWILNFKNQIVEFYVYYVFNMHIKFRSNQILFTIWSINLFFIYNFRLQKFEIITFIW